VWPNQEFRLRRTWPTWPLDGPTLSGAVAALDRSARLLLFLRFYLDLSHEEAGRVLGISGAAAKTRLYRTLRALRPKLELETAL
jgi:DNA-directed RNA polymerase specialized sigma24 family protein